MKKAGGIITIVFGALVLATTGYSLFAVFSQVRDTSEEAFMLAFGAVGGIFALLVIFLGTLGTRRVVSEG